MNDIKFGFGHICWTCIREKGFTERHSSENQRRTDWCKACGHNGEGWKCAYREDDWLRIVPNKEITEKETP